MAAGTAALLSASAIVGGPNPANMVHMPQVMTPNEQVPTTPTTLAPHAVYKFFWPNLSPNYHQVLLFWDEITKNLVVDDIPF